MVDHVRKDGGRTLIVPNIKNADKISSLFHRRYSALIERVRNGVMDPPIFRVPPSRSRIGHRRTYTSVPRLMKNQAVIATERSDIRRSTMPGPQSVVEPGTQQVMMISCTYDHRIIQERSRANSWGG